MMTAVARPRADVERDLASVIARERAGDGGLLLSAFSIQVTTADETPEGAIQTSDWFGVNEIGEDDVEAFWEAGEVVEIAPMDLLYSGQTYISPTALEAVEEDDDLPWVVRVQDRDYIIDGHHRIARARSELKPIAVRRVDYEQAVADGWFDNFFEAIEELRIESEHTELQRS
jgi:hypothetical protein